MQKVIAYPLTVIHLLLFLLCLLIFHPVQWVCYHLIGYQAHKKSVDYLNLGLMGTMLPLLNTFSISAEQKLEKGKSYIFVSNHQSLFDIPPLIWFLRKHHPKFIAKKELAKGIPSISFNLQHGENAAIDRKNPGESIRELIRFARNCHQKTRSVVIFAEGTRSRTGLPKPFKRRGLLTLMKFMPDATIVPVAINKSWKITRYGKFPYGIGNNISLKLLSPIEIKEQNHDELIDRVQDLVHRAVIDYRNDH